MWKSVAPETRFVREMRRVLTRALVLLLTLAAPAAVVRAHDYWIEPDRFIFADAELRLPVLLHLHMGDYFTSEQERPLQLARTTDFRVFAHDRATDLALGAVDGRLPFLSFTPRRAATHLFAMERTPVRHEMPAEQFEAYLREEGLERIIAQRSAARMSLAPGRERYTRHIKSILQIGGRRTNDYRRVLNQKLELVPLRNPYNLGRDGRLPFRVLFEGRPLAGVQVKAYNRASKSTLVTRTDTDGVAHFIVSEPGAWLVRLVHMRACADQAQADWESFWASCTFGVKLRRT